MSPRGRLKRVVASPSGECPKGPIDLFWLQTDTYVTDHLVLSDSTDIPFAEGLIVGQIGAGSRVTVVYSRDDSDGRMLAQSITRRG